MQKKNKKQRKLKLEAYSHKVSLLKTISWRIIATLTTVLLAYLFTNNVETSLKIGGVEFFAKMLFYYLHERGWGWILKK